MLAEFQQFDNYYILPPARLSDDATPAVGKMVVVMLPFTHANQHYLQLPLEMFNTAILECM